MPEYLSTHLTWLTTLWPLFLFSLFIATALWLMTLHLTPRGDRQRTLWCAFGFATLGMTVGLLAGDSGSPVIATVLPAVLSLIGGLAAVIMTRDLAHVLVTALCVSTMSVALLVGALVGMENRGVQEEKAATKVAAKEALGSFSALGAQLDEKIKALKK